MDFPSRLASVLKAVDEESSSRGEGLKEWNEAIETFLASPPAPKSGKSEEESKDQCSKDVVTNLAAHLHQGILTAIQPRLTFEGDLSDEQAEEITRSAVTHFQQTPDDLNKETLADYARSIKNLLRWYIQIYLDKEGRVFPPLLRRLESHAMLELFVRLLEQNHGDVDDVEQEDLARNISLSLFYATFVAFPGDEVTPKALHYLVETLNFPDLVLSILLKPCSAPVALSLVRNIHNLLVSFPGEVKIISATSVEWDSSTQKKAAWAPQNDGTITLRSLFADMARWALHSDPPFPGTEDDKRGELVSEILGCFYALRLGRDLKMTPGDDTTSFYQLILDLLRFPSKEKRVYQCKLSTVSLIMDSNPTFGEYLALNDAVAPLLEILDTQVTDVVEDTRVDDSAAAALVPILAVLNTFCMKNDEFRRRVKDFVFPPEAEEEFQRKAAQQRSQPSTNKNLSPLDAPKGTLRWKMTRLMTWTESYVKRCTSELMWTLCSSEATEFVLRTGLGNAIPMLGLKGFVTMPTSSS